MKKNLMTKMMTKTKNVTTLSLVTSLFYFQTSPYVYAAEAASSGPSDNTAAYIQNIAKVGLSGYAQFLGMKQQSIMAQINANNTAAVMSQMQPKLSASKYFPECSLPASMQNFPANACQVAPNPQTIASNYTYEGAALKMMNYYDQLMNEASNANYAGGIKCLQDRKKGLDSQLTEMVNNLSRMQDNLKLQSEAFKADNKALLNQMEDDNSILMGTRDPGSGSNNIKTKTRDFSKYLNNDCQSVLGQDYSKAAEFGLNGLNIMMEPKNKVATDYTSNHGKIEEEIRAEVDNIRNQIQNNGIDAFANFGAEENPKFPNMQKILKEQMGGLGKERTRIQAEINKLIPGYSLPAMDKNSSVDFQEFVNGAQDFFKKKFVNECVTLADKGVAIPIEKVLESINQKSTNNTGTARDKYKEALVNIMKSDAFINDKLEQIKALDAKYKDITVTYSDSNAKVVTESPYNLFVKTVAACENRFSQDESFSTTNNGGSKQQASQQKLVARAQGYLQEYKNLADGFAVKLSNNILDKMISCSGESKKSGHSCDANTFNHKTDGFCSATANLCANEIKACKAQLTTHVSNLQSRITNGANKFNENVRVMVDRSNLLLKQQIDLSQMITKQVQARFPGTNFEIPNDMMINYPELSKDKFGVDMYANGDMSKFIEDLPKKVENIKNLFRKQQDTAMNEVEDYIGKQKTAMEKEKGRWEKLHASCKQAADQSAQQLAKQNEEGMKRQAEQDKDVKKFCNKYADLKAHPLGACEDAKSLTENWDKIGDRITPNARQLTNDFRKACNSYNNVAEDDPDLDLECENERIYKTTSEIVSCVKKRKRAEQKAKRHASTSTPRPKTISLKDLCGSQKNYDNKKFIKKLISNFPKEMKDKVEDDAVSLDKLEFKDDDFDQAISDLKSFVGSGSDNICSTISKKLNPSTGGNGKIEEHTKEIEEKDKELVVLEKQLKELKDKQEKNRSTGFDKFDEAVENSDISNVQGQIKNRKDRIQVLQDLNKKIAEEDKKKGNPEQDNWQNFLSDLNSLTPVEPSEVEKLETRIATLGQKSDGSCDAQNNSMMAQKNPFSYDLQSFDQGILGKGVGR